MCLGDNHHENRECSERRMETWPVGLCGTTKDNNGGKKNHCIFQMKAQELLQLPS